jgi:hypothetical protein
MATRGAAVGEFLRLIRISRIDKISLQICISVIDITLTYRHCEISASFKERTKFFGIKFSADEIFRTKYFEALFS